MNQAFAGLDDLGFYSTEQLLDIRKRIEDRLQAVACAAKPS